MNIKEFKAGDIITRSEPVKYEFSDTRDGSYCGDRLVFVGVDEVSKIIVLEQEKLLGKFTLSYAREPWNLGWEYFQEKLYAQKNQAFQEILHNKQNYEFIFQKQGNRKKDKRHGRQAI